MATSVSLETVISRLPLSWRGLLRVLSVSDRPLAAGEVWLQENMDSGYGDTLSWTALVESLCVEEPTHCSEGLKFTPRLFHLTPSLQHLLVAVIHQHRQAICVNALQHFVSIMEDYTSTDWLTTYVRWLKLHCQPNRDTSDCSSYTFTAESQDHLRALCKELSTVEHKKRKIIWRIQPCLGGDGSGANVCSSSPGEASSPLPASLPAVNDIETPCRLPTLSPKYASSDSCTSTSIEPVHKKIKLQEEAAAVQEFSIISDIEDTSNSETDGTLDPDIQVKIARLKELWEAGTVEPIPTEELAVFTKCSAQTVTDVCNGLAKSGLSDVAMATACKHLCGVSKEVSHENAMVFASSLLLPLVLGLQGNASRTLLSGLIPFAGPFAKPIILGVLIPCIKSDKFGTNQIDLLTHVLKSLNPADQKEFFRKFLSETAHWNESTSALLQHMLDLKVDMDGEMLSTLMHSLARSGGEQMKGLKFAKVLLNIINKHGKQLTATHIGQLSEVLQSNESFLKKSAMAALTKLKKPQG